MRAVTIHGAGDVRVEHVPDPVLRDPTDVLVQVTHTCVCGSDLWAYRGVSPREPGQRIGHEFIGVVTETGREVTTLRPGDTVVAPFIWSDGTCDRCRTGLPTSCPRSGIWGQPGADGAQGEAVRVPFADATLVRVPADVDDSLAPALLTLTDVMCTGHHGAVAAAVAPGRRVAVVGDGAVGLCAVLAARRLGAEDVVLLGHHEDRARIAHRFGVTATVRSTGEEAVEQARDLSGGRGFDSVVEAVGTATALRTAISVAADGGTVGFVGVPHGGDGSVDVRQMFYRNIALRGGLAPARAYIPELLPDVLSGALDPAPVFDCTVGLDEAPDGYAGMAARQVLKPLIRL
ncbi:zinc-binding dehydrogenase [Micromonospora echinofusca]|uniref:Alcohol dehydrogenase catalytic domain-containing protein n=1 Tax=Micromonospora echinofusca TaxID=47858 RepID=A0ABS3VP73_MICEH|nr:alcohol dehydrogenase catalytic domain-containing protein [Micromonospora echinofusca]MBO4206263.1 alcohol dehydrogenase catalytic domain-containing protein [Micromonospora echinofusca]